MARAATVADLRRKTRPRCVLEVTVPDEDGEEVPVQITLQALTRREYDELIAKHGPTDEQIAEHKERFGRPPAYNIDTFPPALFAASAVDPVLSEDDVTALLEEWSTGECAQLWNTALELNVQSDLVSVKKVSTGMNGSVRS